MNKGHNDEHQVRVGVYARVSTDDQDCAMQLAEIEGWVYNRGWQIADRFVDDGYCGVDKKRPALQRLMEAARLRKVDAVVVWKLDRFGRSVAHLSMLVNELSQLGVRFISITQGIDTDKSNPTSSLLLNLLFCFAEFERETIKERVALGVRRSIAKRRKEQQVPDDAPSPWGRKPKVYDREPIWRLRELGLSVREIVKETGLKHWHVQRAVSDYDAKKG